MILPVDVEHPRTLIREAVVTLLTNQTAAGSRVFDTAAEPYKTSAPPVISVYTLSEPVTTDNANASPREVTRTPRLEIIGWVRDTAAVRLGRAMDRLALEIEVAMVAMRNPPFSPDLVVDCLLENTEMDAMREGDPLLGVVTLTYAVTYRTPADAAVALDDYLRTHTTTQIEGAGPDNTVSDQFDQQP